jgi:hypothetical protein
VGLHVCQAALDNRRDPSEGVAASDEHFRRRRQVKAGDGFQIPIATLHSYRNGDTSAKLTITYIVEKGKPLASPA